MIHHIGVYVVILTRILKVHTNFGYLQFNEYYIYLTCPI
jgi:hypothetical protein